MNSKLMAFHRILSFLDTTEPLKVAKKISPQNKKVHAFLQTP
jgi:hypothetical protein